MKKHHAPLDDLFSWKFLLTPIAGLLLSASGLTAETAWIGTDGNFNAGSNWDSGIAPTENDIAVFDNRAGATSYWLSFGGEDATVQGARFTPTSGTITFTIGDGTTLGVKDVFQVGDGAGANPNVRLKTGTLNVGELVVHPGAFFRMRGELIPAPPPLLITEKGSSIGSPDLLIGDFERAFDWTMAGGTNTFTGTGPVSIADGVRSQATVRVEGATTTWNTGAGHLNVGQRGVGQLLITDGATVSSNAAYLAREHSASAGSSALVSGAGSRWNLSGTLRVGQTFADTRLQILDHGEVVGVDARLGEGAASTDNEVLISGANSRWTLSSHVTLGGSGARNLLHIANGAQMESADFVRIGRDSTLNAAANSNGNKVLIENPGSRWTFVGTPPDASFSLGQRGSENELIIRNGGELLITGSSYLALFPESSNNSAIVTDDGSLWSNSALITLGRQGSNNRLVIEDQATVETGGLFVSTEPSATNNRLEISGGHLIVSEDLHIGIGGQGTLAFAGGTVTAGNLLVDNGSNSVFDFHSGRLETGSAVIANGSPLTVGDGDACAMWFIGEGPHFAQDGVNISTSGKLGGAGTLTANVISDGQILPGASIATLTIDGGLTLEGNSQLQMEIAGASEGEFDVLVVSGHTAINGFLSVLFVDGYTPAAGDNFKLLDFASASGAFEILDLPELPAGLAWNSDGLYTEGRLSITGESTGGFNDWRAAWFTPEELADDEISGPHANPAGDGVTNLMRYALGLDPFEPGRDALPTVSLEAFHVDGVEGLYLTLTFTRPAGRSDITYAVNASGNLTDWQSTPVEMSQSENPDGTITVIYRDSVPTDETSRRFLRLVVEFN